jgi:hypothetical protein
MTAENFVNKKEKNTLKLCQSQYHCTVLLGVAGNLSFIFCIPIWIIFLKTWETSLMNVEKSSIGIFPKMSRGVVENGVQVCWLSTAAVL